MKDFYELQEEYFEYMTLLNRSKTTIRGHRFHLGKFFEFLKGYAIQGITDIHREHILEYQKHLHYSQNQYGRAHQVRYRNRHLAVIKSFFKYLKQVGYVIRDPSNESQYAKEPKTLPKPALTNPEMKKLLKMPDTNTILGYRDRAILELLYSTGIRKQELLNLRLEEVDTEEGFLRVNLGKGAKDRVVPIGKIACKYLETYIKGIRPLIFKAKDKTALFISKRGNPLSKNGLGEIIGKYAQESGLQKHITTHTFRRSCATEMIKNKANLMHVKELLGHNSMDTIQAYCNLSIVDLKEAHQKCHPRERDEK